MALAGAVSSRSRPVRSWRLWPDTVGNCRSRQSPGSRGSRRSHSVTPAMRPRPPAGWTLEVGCGEGRVARDPAPRGHDVTALDSAADLVRHARDADAAGAYLVAGGARLPIRDGCFDIVVAYNALQVV